MMKMFHSVRWPGVGLFEKIVKNTKIHNLNWFSFSTKSHKTLPKHQTVILVLDNRLKFQNNISATSRKKSKCKRQMGGSLMPKKRPRRFSTEFVSAGVCQIILFMNIWLSELEDMCSVQEWSITEITQFIEYRNCPYDLPNPAAKSSAWSSLLLAPISVWSLPLADRYQSVTVNHLSRRRVDYNSLTLLYF